VGGKRGKYDRRSNWPRKYRESQGHLFYYQPGKFLIGVVDDAGWLLRNLVADVVSCLVNLVDDAISYLHGAIWRHKRLSAFLFVVASIVAAVLASRYQGLSNK